LTIDDCTRVVNRQPHIVHQELASFRGRDTVKQANVKGISPNHKVIPELSPPSLERLTIYYQVALRAGEDGREHLSSAFLAGLVAVDETLVRKDLATVSIVGRPHVGFSTGEIIGRLQYILGLSEITDAVLIGSGSLGSALLRYPGFAKYGLRITAAFDTDPGKVGQRIGEYVVLPMEKCRSIIDTFRVRVAILSIPADSAQGMVNWLVGRDIRAIWNFAPVQLQAPPPVIVRNENLAVGLAQLIHQVRHSKGQEEGR
jgi:redox-sensing transcriptional repressor